MSNKRKYPLTQKDLFELSGVSISALTRIELGQVLPKHDTLDLLTDFLRVDLNKLLLEYRIDKYESLKKIEESILRKTEIIDYNGLSDEMNLLRELITSNMSGYYNIRCNQLLLYVESMISEPSARDFARRIKNLTMALNLSIHNFTIVNYELYKYGDLDLLLLMNIGLAKRHTDGNKKSLETLKFCYDFFNKNILSSDFLLYEKLCYNLSYAYHRMKQYEDALQYSCSGVDYCNKHRKYHTIGLLYARKGNAEHLLNNDNSIASLLKAKRFLEMTGHHKNLKKLIFACKNHYDIDLLNLR
ncbi:MAG: helix-turn-helix domain-containing protein [Alkaliphilus sp.]